MPFAEPRPHRRPFKAWADNFTLIVSPKHAGGNLALTSFTVSSQSEIPRFVSLLSRKGNTDSILLMVFVRGGETLHFPFPHPIMVGTDSSLVVDVMAHSGALLPFTVVGYEWNRNDIRSPFSFLSYLITAIKNFFRRK